MGASPLFLSFLAQELLPPGNHEPQLEKVRVLDTEHMEDSRVISVGMVGAVPETRSVEFRPVPNRGADGEDLETVLAGWWQELLAVEEVNSDDDFFELGGHSLIGVQLFSKIKKTYGVDLGLSILFDARTVRQLAQVIRQNAKPGEAEPKPFCTLVPLQPKGSRPPLFWIPGGNGTSVLLFKEVSDLLGSDQPAYGIEARMPEPDQEFDSIAERATRFVREVRALQPQGPYSLIGFCGGGYIAFEMAQQLSAEGQEVAFLGIVECADPRYPSSWPGKVRFRAERAVWRIQKFLERGPKGIARWAAERSKGLGQAIHLHAERVEARLLGKPVPPLPAEPVDMYAKARRTVDRYQPVSYRGKSVVLIGEDTYQFCGLSPSVDPRLLWCKLSESGSEVRTVPGDHTDMLEAPLVYRFAEELKDLLQRNNASIH